MKALRPARDYILNISANKKKLASAKPAPKPAVPAKPVKPIHEDAALLTPAQVAVRLGITVRTLWRYVKQGIFPPADLRVGERLIRWRRTTVDAWTGSKSSPQNEQ